ncbi:ankyrin repeat protein, partial [Ancylostoma duodenale]
MLEHDSSGGNENENEELGHNLGLTEELIDEIRSTKANNPGMFVSAWQEDDQGVREADLRNEIDNFLKEAENGNIGVMRSMLDNDPGLLSACDEDGYTALHRAAYNNHLEAVSFLLEMGANPEARTREGWTPLHSAANWGNYKIIGRLISHGVDVNARSAGSVTPLHLTINSQCENSENVFHCVRYLLQAPGIDASVP